MTATQFLLDFAVVLIAAEIGGTLFRRAHLPRAVGMLVAGIALGPFTPGYVVDIGGIEDLALLGAVFLMFSSGLSYDIRGFRALGLWPFLLAGLGVGTSFVFGLLLGLLVGWSLLASLFLGLLLTSTSTTLSLKFLGDSGLSNVPGAGLVTAAILVDDILALSLMTLAVGLAAPEPVPFPALLAGLGGILALAALLVLVGRHALPRLLRATESVSPGSVVMIAVSLGLLVSFAFALLGLPPLVGAFFAGSIIASTEFGARVTRHMVPVTAIFTAVFFTSIGFLIDPGRLPSVAILGLALVLIAVPAKMIPGAAVLRWKARMPRADSWALATVLLPRAEISLIIAQFGILVGAPAELLGLAMILMVGTALLPGPLLGLTRRASRLPPAANGP